MRPPSRLQAPAIAFGRAIAGDLASAIRREWLVTNGIGGFASGTLAGIATRRYHGLLIAATEPPVGRRVFVGGLVETVTYRGATVALHAHEFANGTIEGAGFELVESFALEGSVPVWTYAIGDALLERRVWMGRATNTTYVRYRLARGGGPARLAVSALVTDRDIHQLTRGKAGNEPAVEPIDGGVVVHGSPAVLGGWPSSARLRVVASNGSFDPTGAWWWGFRHREETARGQDDVADLYLAGTHSMTLQPGESWTLVLSTEADPDLDGEAALAVVEARDSELLGRAGTQRASGFVRRLVLAADAFIVRRDVAPAGGPEPRSPIEGRSVIAGYPWFNDWGRDTMIALPGLTLATGRPEDGAAVLRAFGRWIADGLLPNDFPSSADARPEYNTVDAALWYVQAVRAHHEATADDNLLDELLPGLRVVVDAHVAGTRHGIGVDHRDGLLAAGEPGIQLTWMDARLDDWVVTPRIGKPVEINALWYNALCTVGPWLIARADAAAGHSYMALAEQVSRSFRARFWRPELGHLADVVDGPDGDDMSLRPNQVFALSLPFALVEGAAARATLEAVGRALLTSYGLRTLSPSDPAYLGRHEGDRRARDGAYHQGPAWAWLMGAYAEAVDRVTGDQAAALSILRPFEAHLADAGIGSISELFDGDAPHRPRGCPAQAWSVAEVLRVWRLLARE
jgi:predicted glycogen debranching enzyme